VSNFTGSKLSYMAGAEDHVLVKRFQDGDETAFNEIVLRYQERIYWAVRRFVIDHDDVADLVQEVFIKAHAALAGFRGESSLYTWLYRIATNLSLNFLRWKKVKQVMRMDDVYTEPHAPESNPEEMVDRDERRILIERAIESLPEKQKAVFVMRYYEDLSYEEIAAILKTSIGGLKANYFHAVRKIEEFLKNAYE